MDYLTDTTFLIDLWRERRTPGAAVHFAETHGSAIVGLPWVVKGEFLRGAMVAGHAPNAVSAFLASFVMVWPTETTLLRYADTYAGLRKANALIGPLDLWVAAAALEHDLPVLTRNITEFGRVKDLRVAAYSGGGVADSDQ